MTSPPERITDLIDVIQRLSQARDVATVQDIVRRAARRLTQADGATFVLCEGDRCHYVDEDAIGPLWKGQKFPMSACVSGWAMLNRSTAVIEDVFADSASTTRCLSRHLRQKYGDGARAHQVDPLGAIGTYWAKKHPPTEEEVRLLEAARGHDRCGSGKR